MQNYLTYKYTHSFDQGGLTLYCLARHIPMRRSDQNFDFNLGRDHQKNFLIASRLLWVSRQKENILGDVPKNYEELRQ